MLSQVVEVLKCLRGSGQSGRLHRMREGFLNFMIAEGACLWKGRWWLRDNVLGFQKAKALDAYIPQEQLGESSMCC